MNVRVPEGAAYKSSRLIEVIRSLAGSHSGAAVGFRRPEAERKRVTAVVAAFAARDIDAAATAVSAGVDALEFTVLTEKDARAVADAIGRLTVPVGIAVSTEIDKTLAGAVAGSGADWVRLPLGASVATIAWSRPSRMLTIPISLDLELARGLSGLNVDSFLVEPTDDAQSAFTYLDALRLRAIGSYVKRPLLLSTGKHLPPDFAATAEHLGVDALFLPRGVATHTRAAEYLKALELHAGSSR